MKAYLKMTITVVVLGLAFWLIFSKKGLFCSDKNFAYTDIDEISRIEIINYNDSLLTTLEFMDNEWMINGEHIANIEMIEDLKFVISKLEVEYPLPKIYAEVLTDSVIMVQGMNVKIYAGKSLKRDYFLYTSDSLDCVGLLKGKQQAYSLYMPGIPLNPIDYLNANPVFWLDNVAFSYLPKDIVSVEVENMQQPDQSFKIINGVDNQFKLIDSYNLREMPNIDTMAVKRYLTYFNKAIFDRYTDFSDIERQELLLSDYAYVLTIETKDKKDVYRVIYIPANDDFDAYGNTLEYDRQQFYLSINGGKDIVIASWLNFNILLKNLSDFVNN